ncbi:MAG TPA: sigma-70 family RNA polymerase sigma factor [Sporolactobacillaceae bacterium]|nr:sigma-70 family RNA polymerase sigma factor [Sporolactobacillaceae bacterium]
MKLIDGVLMSEEEVTIQYKNMVYKLAHRYKRHARAIGIMFEDVVQEGYLGLIKSYRQFDSEKNVKFITYSYDIVKYAILHHLRDYRLVRTPRKYRMLFLQLIKEELGESEPEEIAHLLKLPLEDVRKALFYNSSNFISSFNKPVRTKRHDDSDNGLSLGISLLEGTRDDLTNIYTDLLFEDLDNRLSFVLRERLKEYSQPEIARMMDRTQSTVCRYIQEIKDIYLTNHA